MSGYTSTTDADRAAMLAAIGVDSVEELFDGVPAEVRMDRPLDLPDGLTEAENFDGEMWGTARLETFLQRRDLPTPRLPSLIDAVLEHVNLAPPSDDISVVEIEATPIAASRADAA